MHLSYLFILIDYQDIEKREFHIFSVYASNFRISYTILIM